MEIYPLNSDARWIGPYVCLKLDRREWKMGRPADKNDPANGVFVEGSVSYHPTLKDALKVVRLRNKLCAVRY